jgi:hypothetical protein
LIVSAIQCFTGETVFYGRLKDFIDQHGMDEAKLLWNKLDSSKKKLEVA